jgi:uncharacterized membrane protein
MRVLRFKRLNGLACFAPTAIITSGISIIWMLFFEGAADVNGIFIVCFAYFLLVIVVIQMRIPKTSYHSSQIQNNSEQSIGTTSSVKVP